MIDTRTPSRRPDPDEGLESHEADTARLWLSDRQWMSILRQVETGDAQTDPATPAPGDHVSGGASDATGHRDHARHALSFRCVIRLAPPQRRNDDHGTYLVHSRNISAGGLGFVHNHPLHPGTRCTVALQPMHGKGMILAARVAWCREVDRPAEDTLGFDVGVQFDRPIDISVFVTAA
jgi:hypothetical protein